MAFDSLETYAGLEGKPLIEALLRDFPEQAHYFSQPYVSLGKRQLRNHNAFHAV